MISYSCNRIPTLNYQLISKLTWNKRKENPITDEDLQKIANEYKDIHTKACYLEHQLITLSEENKRLAHENNFMLKLINEKENV